MKRKFIFIKYVSLNMLSMVGLSCYILADTLFIANGVGPQGLTALNLILPLYTVISAFGLMMGVGSATRFSILSVQQKDHEASCYYTITVKFALAVSIPLVLIGFFFAKDIMQLMGANYEVLDIATIYLQTFIVFTPFFVLEQIIVTFVRNDHNPRLASLAMLLATLFNIVFDYILVFPCQLGMFGAALATGFSPIVALLICSLHVFHKHNHFHFIKCSFDFHYLWQIITVGIPTFITELSGGIIIFVFNIIILSIGGNIAVASYGIVSNLALVVTALYTGIAQGVQPLLSQSYGKHQHQLTTSYFRYALISSLTISCLVYFSILVFPETIVSFFNNESNLQMATIATQALPLYFFGFFFAGINMVFISYLASTQNMKPSFLLSLLRGGLIMLPLVLILSNYFQLIGVWIAFPISELIVMFIALLHLKSLSKSA